VTGVRVGQFTRNQHTRRTGARSLTMNLLYEDLARAQCREMLKASHEERLARRLQSQRRAVRLARRASRLAQRASAWAEAPATSA